MRNYYGKLEDREYFIEQSGQGLYDIYYILLGSIHEVLEIY